MSGVSRTLAVGLLLATVGGARAERYMIRCDRGEAGFPYIKRTPPDAYHKTYPACQGAVGKACQMGFCPSMALILSCINTHCGIPLSQCPLESDGQPVPQSGDWFLVRPHHPVRVHAGNNRVTLRCHP